MHVPGTHRSDCDVPGQRTVAVTLRRDVARITNPHPVQGTTGLQQRGSICSQSHVKAERDGYELRRDVARITKPNAVQGTTGLQQRGSICSQSHVTAERDGYGRWRYCLVLLCIVLSAGSGCSPTRYRLDADRETYGIINSKTNDPRWFVPQSSIDPHPHARYADPFDPDRPPMPPDDPTAHVDMHYPNGMRGYRHWHCDGDAPWIESPAWQEYLELSEDGTLYLTRERAVELGLLHSREYQLELEDLYLTCLALSLERFQYDTQWFFSNITQFFHFGSGPNEVNNLSTSSELGFRRTFAAGGQLLVDLSNAFVWQFAGTDSLTVQSNLAVSFVQPLLRDAGRNIELESLTQSERNVIYAAREFARFRKQFYFNVVSGEGGYLALLLRVQNIRNFEANVKSLELDLRTHEALAEAGIISRIQVDQVFQSFQNGRLALVRARNDFQTALDAYKIRLGLPPTMPVTLDDSLLAPFEFSDRQITELEEHFDRLLAQYRELDVAPEAAQLRRGFEELAGPYPRVKELLNQIRDDVGKAKRPDVATGTPEQQSAEAYRLATLKQAEERLTELIQELDKLIDEAHKAAASVADNTRADHWELLQKLIRQQISIVSEMYVIQTRIRAYHVELQEIDMTPEIAVQMALENRLDLMNQQARVVDNWRRIKIVANRLKSDLDISGGANVGTEAGNLNPLDFASSASSYRAGVRFDGPLNRKAERNAYRAQLVQYQRVRRDYMALADRAVQAVRSDMRDLSTFRINFEIARQSLVSAARQVEMSRDQLLLPARAGESETDSSSTQDTLIALNSLLQAKNALISIWVDFETTRLQLLLNTEALQPDPSREPSHEYLDHPIDGEPSHELLPPPVRVEIDDDMAVQP